MSQHNFGPWRRGNAHGAGPGYAIAEGPYVVARVVGCGYPTGIGAHPRSDAVANLIAAAPDLLAVLERAVRWQDGHRDDPWLEDARTAIAAAKGEG